MKPWLLVGVLLAGVVWVYSPALSGGFVYLDTRTSDICGHEPAWGVRGRPLSLASWCLQSGQSPRAYHLVSLGLHLGVSALVGLLLWRLTGGALPALMGMSLFALHGGNVEAVAYLTGRSELIGALGIVGACVAALERRWVLMAVCVGVGVLGKESASVALMLVPLCLWMQSPSRRRLLLTAGATLALVAVIVALTVSGNWWDWGTPHPLTWAMWQISAMGRLLSLTVLPWEQTLDADYAWPLVRQIGAVGFVTTVGVWAWSQRTRRPFVWAGFCWMALAALPRLVVPTPRSIFPEHQFYVPNVGVSLAFAGLFTQERVWI